MGLACPDYDWHAALQLLAKHRVPLLSTVTSFSEGLADGDVLARYGLQQVFNRRNALAPLVYVRGG